MINLSSGDNFLEPLPPKKDIYKIFLFSNYFIRSFILFNERLSASQTLWNAHQNHDIRSAFNERTNNPWFLVSRKPLHGA